MSVYRNQKQNLTDQHLDWNSSHIMSAEISSPCDCLQAKYVYSISEILAIEMDYLQKVLLKNNYPDLIIKEP